MKNIRFNTLLKTEAYSDGSYWQMAYRYVKGISEFDLEVVPSTKITEDNINTVFKAFNVPANQIGIMENLTHDDFMTILERYAKLQGFHVNYVMVDPEREAREAYLESLA